MQAAAVCTHPGNNAICSQEGIMSATTASVPLPTPQQPHSQASAALAIIRHVIDDIIGTIFTSSAGGTNVSPQISFPSAQSPGAITTTAVTLKPGISSITLLLQQANATAATAAYHNKCSGGGDIITCTYNKDAVCQSFDTKAGSLMNMFDFTTNLYVKKLFLDTLTGLEK
jgi:hypothetical protein